MLTITGVCLVLLCILLFLLGVEIGKSKSARIASNPATTQTQQTILPATKDAPMLKEAAVEMAPSKP
jgi:hypothetical protein